MKRNITHTVKTIAFEIDADSETHAQSCVDTIRQIDIEALITKALQPYDNVREWIGIGTLDIALGSMDMHDEKKWSQEILSQLSEQLRLKISQHEESTQQFSIIGGSKILSETETQYPTPGYSRDVEALLFYLEHGFLPWNVSELPPLENLIAELQREHPAYLITKFKTSLNKYQVRKRIAWVFNEDALLSLVQILLDPPLCRMAAALHYIFKAVSVRFVQEEILRTVVISMLKAVARNPSSPNAFIQSVWEENNTIASYFTTTKWKLFFEELGREYQRSSGHDLNIVKQVSAHILHSLESLQKEPLEMQPPGINENPQANAGPLKKHNRSTLEEKDEQEAYPPPVILKQIDLTPEPIDHSDESVLFIDNTGLVLLNQGMIAQRFESLGWTREKEFVGEATRNKAIGWLHYLAYGEEEIPEYRLVLNKILCGIDPEDVAGIDVSLTEAERQEADDTLRSVIAYWDALKNISIESLRRSFLQRSGRLKREGSGWHLHAESKTYDILIEKIPWTFSITKFPWMTKPIYTQWLTRT